MPVNYLPRVGDSSVTGDLGKAVVLGIEMVVLITDIRLRTLGRGSRPALRTPPMHAVPAAEAPSALAPVRAVA